MGARGPVPFDPEKRKLRGTRSRSKPTVAARTPPGIPVPPRGLTGEALAEWKRVVPLLAERRVLAQTDRAMLVMYCRTWARWNDLDRHLGEAYTTTGSKSTIMNPLLRAWRDTTQLLAGLVKQLGLDPTSRLRMPAPPSADDEPIDELDRMRLRAIMDDRR